MALSPVLSLFPSKCSGLFLIRLLKIPHHLQDKDWAASYDRQDSRLLRMLSTWLHLPDPGPDRLSLLNCSTYLAEFGAFVFLLVLLSRTLFLSSLLGPVPVVL